MLHVPLPTARSQQLARRGLGVLLLGALLAGCDARTAPLSTPSTPTSQPSATLTSQLSSTSQPTSQPAATSTSQGERLPGILLCGPEATAEGALLITRLGARRADLMHADGRPIHAWHEAAGLRWQSALLLEGGDLAVVSTVQKKRGNHTYVVRFDVHGGERWRTQLNVQHDLALEPGGGLLALTRGSKRVQLGEQSQRIRDNHITPLALDGRLGKWQSIYEMLDGDPRFTWQAPPLESAEGDDADANDAPDDSAPGDTADADVDSAPGDTATGEPSQPASDLLHASALEPLRRGLPFTGEATQPVLVALRNQGRVVLVDRANATLLWVGGEGLLQQPVAATYADGRVYVLDGGREGGAARVLALDVGNGTVAWEYRATPPESFSTPTQGALQVLPGGHLLVSATDQGEAFELDPAGAVVWRFRNPELGDGGRPAAVRATWIEPALLASVPKQSSVPSPSSVPGAR